MLQVRGLGHVEVGSLSLMTHGVKHGTVGTTTESSMKNREMKDRYRPILENIFAPLKSGIIVLGNMHPYHRFCMPTYYSLCLVKQAIRISPAPLVHVP
jgi:hypothetical protein